MIFLPSVVKKQLVKTSGINKSNISNLFFFTSLITRSNWIIDRTSGKWKEGGFVNAWQPSGDFEEPSG